MDGFQWNLAQIFIILVDIAEKVLKVGGQMSRSYYYGWDMHFNEGLPA